MRDDLKDKICIPSPVHQIAREETKHGSDMGRSEGSKNEFGSIVLDLLEFRKRYLGQPTKSELQ